LTGAAGAITIEVANPVTRMVPDGARPMGRRKKREGEPRRDYLVRIVDEAIRSDRPPTHENQVVQLVIAEYPHLASWRSECWTSPGACWG